MQQLWPAGATCPVCVLHTQEVLKLQQKNATLQQQLQAIQEEDDKHIAGLEEEKKQLQLALQTQQRNHELQSQALAQQLYASQEQLQARQQLLHATQQELEASKSSHINLTEQLQEKVKQLAAVQGQLEAVRASVAEQQASAKAAQAQWHRKEQELEDHLRKLKKEVKEANKKTRESEDEQEKLQRKLRLSEADLAATQKRKDEISNDYNHLQTRLHQAQTALRLAEVSRDRADQALRGAQASADRQKERAEDHAKQESARAKELRNVRAELEKARLELQLAQQLKQDLTAAQQANEHKDIQVEAKVKVLHEKLLLSQKVNQTLQQQLDRADELHKVAAGQAQAQISELHGQVDNMRTEVQAMRTQLQQLQADAAMLEDVKLGTGLNDQLTADKEALNATVLSLRQRLKQIEAQRVVLNIHVHVAEQEEPCVSSGMKRKRDGAACGEVAKGAVTGHHSLQVLGQDQGIGHGGHEMGQLTQQAVQEPCIDAEMVGPEAGAAGSDLQASTTQGPTPGTLRSYSSSSCCQEQGGLGGAAVAATMQPAAASADPAAAMVSVKQEPVDGGAGPILEQYQPARNQAAGTGAGDVDMTDAVATPVKAATAVTPADTGSPALPKGTTLVLGKLPDSPRAGLTGTDQRTGVRPNPGFYSPVAAAATPTTVTASPKPAAPVLAAASEPATTAAAEAGDMVTMHPEQHRPTVMTPTKVSDGVVAPAAPADAAAQHAAVQGMAQTAWQCSSYPPPYAGPYADASQQPYYASYSYGTSYVPYNSPGAYGSSPYYHDPAYMQAAAYAAAGNMSGMAYAPPGYGAASSVQYSPPAAARAPSGPHYSSPAQPTGTGTPSTAACTTTPQKQSGMAVEAPSVPTGTLFSHQAAILRRFGLVALFMKPMWHITVRVVLA